MTRNYAFIVWALCEGSTDYTLKYGRWIKNRDNRKIITLRRERACEEVLFMIFIKIDYSIVGFILKVTLPYTNMLAV